MLGLSVDPPSGTTLKDKLGLKLYVDDEKKFDGNIYKTSGPNTWCLKRDKSNISMCAYFFSLFLFLLVLFSVVKSNSTIRVKVFEHHTFHSNKAFFETNVGTSDLLQSCTSIPDDNNAEGTNVSLGYNLHFISS